MKLSLDWLSEYVEFSETDPQMLADAITLSIAEVDEVEEQGALLGNCCVGKVLTVEKHPNADKLKLCDVETDKGKKRVVCGGTNLREGMLVAFAHIGARVKWHGEEMMELKKTKIRGEESEGMICAAEELELTAQFHDAVGHNIVDMGDAGYTVGDSLKKALGLHDTVFHIDNHAITHRADLFSHIGFARECVAIGLGKWKKDPVTKAPKFAKDNIPFAFKVDEPKLMPRYCSCLIEIDGIGETPDWMVKRLAATGWRSLNLPIDITNYVAMEVGVPLHSFDADDIKGTVHMRTAKKGEKIVTLDKQERALPEGGLVLSDDEGIFDLLGIMGGLRSSTKTTTKRIYLHSASLDPMSIRRTVIATGLRTDAATVYEKGVPHVITEQGFYRAIQLILELVPGARIASLMDSKGDNGDPKPITLSLERASSVLGREITKDEATKVLTALDFTVESVASSHGSMLRVSPPLHRLGDIKGPIDLMEEIARVAGFLSFEEELPHSSIIPPVRDHRVHRVRDTLKGAGFYESVQFAFLGEELLKRADEEPKSIDAIENPLGEDLKIMRPSLLPRLLEFAEENIKLQDDVLQVFEIGHTFHKEGEKTVLTLLVADKRDGGIKQEPFLLAKSAVEEILHALNEEAAFSAQKKVPKNVHPARSVELKLGKTGIGTVSEVHPSITKAFHLPHRAAFAAVDLDALLGTPSPERLYKDISDFPSIEYDTTVSLAPTVQVGSVLQKARGLHNLIRSVELVDMFRKGNERHLTFRCTYNAPDRTLTEEEVKPIHEKVEAALAG